MPVFRIGSRGSPLALTQAHMVRDALMAAHGWDAKAVEIVVIRTTGDRVQDRALAEIGGKALWTKELDRALLGGEIDCAVHSMKDVETIRPASIVIAAILERAVTCDRIIGAESIAALREGAVVGTSSPRRSAQLRKLRPDLEIVLFRGNVDSRLAKLAAGEADATLLAAAGLVRLGRHDVGHAIPVEQMLPAPAQGAIGIEARADDGDTQELLAPLNHADTDICIRTERAFLATLGADCHSPVAALATVAGPSIVLRGELLAMDGSAHVAGNGAAPAGDPDLAPSLAHDLLAEAPESIRSLFAGA